MTYGVITGNLCSCYIVCNGLPTSMVRPFWCGRYGVATMVCTIRCGDSMVLVFYGARQYGAMVRRIFGGPYIRAVF